MIHAAEIKNVIFRHIAPGEWVHIHAIYELVERHTTPGEDDTSPSAQGKREPKWHRNVRNVLKELTDTGKLLWDNDEHYMLPGVDVAEQVDAARAAEAAAARRQGFGSDAATKRAIELHAMAIAKAHFAEQEYDVDDVSARRPYDLECRRADEVVFVEVKGTQGHGQEVLLTKNEVEFARRNAPDMSLVIVSGITLDAQGRPQGGNKEAITPWNVDGGELVPYGYSHKPHSRDAAETAENRVPAPHWHV